MALSARSSFLLAATPSCLTLITLLQFAEGLSDRESGGMPREAEKQY
ncbi:hypothetical protein X737_31265 [Mesorhizobium sp. L48C026A00]|nr:hypothetical protein X737_31265 [Mesorhizobium sp. L48C026A00]